MPKLSSRSYNMKKRMATREVDKIVAKQEREDFLNETCFAFIEKKGVKLWDEAQRMLINQAGPVDEQTIFEMGLRIGWKAALRAALADKLPKDDGDGE